MQIDAHSVLSWRQSYALTTAELDSTGVTVKTSALGEIAMYLTYEQLRLILDKAKKLGYKAGTNRNYDV